MKYFKVVLVSICLFFVMSPGADASQFNGTVAQFYDEYGDDLQLEMITIDGNIYDFAQGITNDPPGYWKCSFNKNGIEIGGSHSSIVPEEDWPVYYNIRYLNNKYSIMANVYFPPTEKWIKYFVEDLSGSSNVKYYVALNAVQSSEEMLKDKVRITMPMYDGYKDTTPMQVIWFAYGVPVPSSGNVSDIEIQIEGGVDETGHVISASGHIKDGYYYGNMSIDRELKMGNNTITVKVISDNKTYQDKRVIIRLQGQVDEDGDGIDDRTGFPIWPDDPNNWGGATDGPPPLPGEDATIFDYIKWFADSVLYSIGLLVTAIKGFLGGIGQISRMFGEIFVWIPSELISIMILGLCMTVILRVVGR